MKLEIKDLSRFLIKPITSIDQTPAIYFREYSKEVEKSIKVNETPPIFLCNPFLKDSTWINSSVKKAYIHDTDYSHADWAGIQYFISTDENPENVKYFQKFKNGYFAHIINDSGFFDGCYYNNTIIDLTEEMSDKNTNTNFAVFDSEIEAKRYIQRIKKEGREIILQELIDKTTAEISELKNNLEGFIKELEKLRKK